MKKWYSFSCEIRIQLALSLWFQHKERARVKTLPCNSTLHHVSFPNRFYTREIAKRITRLKQEYYTLRNFITIDTIALLIVSAAFSLYFSLWLLLCSNNNNISSRGCWDKGKPSKIKGSIYLSSEKRSFCYLKSL